MQFWAPTARSLDRVTTTGSPRNGSGSRPLVQSRSLTMTVGVVVPPSTPPGGAVTSTWDRPRGSATLSWQSPQPEKSSPVPVLSRVTYWAPAPGPDSADHSPTPSTATSRPSNGPAARAIHGASSAPCSRIACGASAGASVKMSANAARTSASSTSPAIPPSIAETARRGGHRSRPARARSAPEPPGRWRCRTWTDPPRRAAPRRPPARRPRRRLQPRPARPSYADGDGLEGGHRPPAHQRPGRRRRRTPARRRAASRSHSWPSSFLSTTSPRQTRERTVPSRTPVMAAISAYSSCS